MAMAAGACCCACPSPSSSSISHRPRRGRQMLTPVSMCSSSSSISSLLSPPPHLPVPAALALARGNGGGRLRIFSGSANPLLAQEISCYLGMELGKIKIKRFADGEIYVQLQESVRGCDVFLVQPTCPPANENLMELLIMIDACRRASAKTITAVIPYFGYARADLKTQGRESIAAKLVANLITEAGAHRVLGEALVLHHRHGVGDDHLLEEAAGEPLQRRRAEHGVGAAGVDGASPLLVQQLGALGDGTGGVDHVVHHDGDLPPDVADEVHHLGLVVAVPPLVDDGQRRVGELLGEGARPGHPYLLGETIWRVHDDCSVSNIFQ